MSRSNDAYMDLITGVSKMLTNPIKLTIGFAMFDDFYGAYDTIQDIRLYHPEITEQIEIVVVDNNPGSPHSREFQQFMGKVYDRTPDACNINGHKANLGGFQYIDMDSPRGTSAPRNRVFEVARGEWVICCDSHVKFPPGVLRRFLEWIGRNGESKDLISGPLMYDPLDIYSDHFASFWRGQMWGIWASTWKCPCGNYLFTCRNNDEGKLVSYTLKSPTSYVERCYSCGRYFPNLIPWSQHEFSLKEKGYTLVVEDDKAESFEIPGQGLGMFACRKDAWLGFNPLFRGFGGEEMYIHEKFRQAGRKNLCLPWFKWLHRFGRVGGVNPHHGYNNWNKCRNYVIGLTEIGFSLDPVYAQFVETKLVSKTEWKILTNDPSNPPEFSNEKVPNTAPNPTPIRVFDNLFPHELPNVSAYHSLDVSHGGIELVNQHGKPPTKGEFVFAKSDTTKLEQLRRMSEELARAIKEAKSTVTSLSENKETKEMSYPSIEKWFELNKNRGHDFLAHQDYLKKISSESNTVMELGGRRGSSTVALLAGQPKRLIVVDPNPGSEWMDLARLAGRTELIHEAERSEDYEPMMDDSIDLLLIDTNHNKTQLLKEFEYYSHHVNRRIVIHDTVLHATKGENGGEGLLPAIDEFLKNNPEWFVANHDPLQYGLTTLSRDERDRPDPAKAPSINQPDFSSEKPIGRGPGTELKLLLESIGIRASTSCSCNANAAQMDRWQVQGCRDNFNTIVGIIRDNLSKWGWKDKLLSAASGASSPLRSLLNLAKLSFKVNWSDPIPGIVEEAINRAEEKEKLLEKKE